MSTAEVKLSLSAEPQGAWVEPTCHPADQGWAEPEALSPCNYTLSLAASARCVAMPHPSSRQLLDIIIHAPEEESWEKEVTVVAVRLHGVASQRGLRSYGQGWLMHS